MLVGLTIYAMRRRISAAAFLGALGFMLSRLNPNFIFSPIHAVTPPPVSEGKHFLLRLACR